MSNKPTLTQVQSLFIKHHNLPSSWQINHDDYIQVLEQLDTLNEFQIEMDLSDLIKHYYKVDTATSRPIQEGYEMFGSMYFADLENILAAANNGVNQFEDAQDVLDFYGFDNPEDENTVIFYKHWGLESLVLA